MTEITPSALSFVDSETPSEKLVYSITKPLPSGQGQPHTHTLVQLFSHNVEKINRIKI